MRRQLVKRRLDAAVKDYDQELSSLGENEPRAVFHTNRQVYILVSPQQHGGKEVYVLNNQQLPDQDRNSSLERNVQAGVLQRENREEPEPPQVKVEHEEPEPLQVKEEHVEPEPPQVKEEQKEVCISQDEEQLVIKEETTLLMITGNSEESDSSESEPTSTQLVSASSSIKELSLDIDETKLYVCNACGKTFSKLSQTRRQKTHKDKKTYSCATCLKSFYSISELKNFPKLDFESQCELISNGRPTPTLKGLFEKSGITGRQYMRFFQTEWYTRKDWLCGCANRNRLYCFPCLLFSTCDSVWTSTGFGDLKHLQRGFISHEKSAAHIQSQIALKTFGTSRIDLAVDEQRKLNASIHNARVKENREILKDLISVTCFLTKQELAFHGNGECINSSHIDLLHAFAEKDIKLAQLLKASTVFSGLSNSIHNDLTEAIGDVIRNDIKKEIDAAVFVAIEVDETTDVTNKAQISAILRYIAKTEVDLEVREVFLGFDDVSDDRRASAVAEYILGVLEKYKCAEKLVAQTYDGAAVMASELDGVQTRVQEKVPHAMLTHCYAHDLNLVLLHSAKCMPQCRTFCKIVEGLGTFLGKSSKLTHILDDVVKRRLPKAEPVSWNSNSRLVQNIGKHYFDLRAAFSMMNENPDGWDNDTLIMAAGYNQWLSKESTLFFIMAYKNIFSETDELHRVLQNKVMDTKFCCARICDTIGAVERQRREFDSFYDGFERKCVTLGLTEKIQRNQALRDERKQMFFSILDNVCVQLKARFDHFGDLAFLSLVDCSKFLKMSKHFDNAKLQSLSKYAKFFDFGRLKAELIGLHSSQTVRDECKSPKQLLNFLTQNDLMQTVPEVTKLLQLVLTIPVTAVSEKTSFSALERLKAHSQNWTDQRRLSSLALISIERDRFLKLQENKEDFYNKVTESFVQKDGRMDFIYK
ncbi:zinc finger MYM-type protein 1 [Kryptolebias marmoratus]|uniref:Zinc finger MYM-type protein 1-like n=1 Tax=Kryptolebias marmoratus TaxID=37003 RepID=A0A3Q3ABF6_KRYMA|nr:zinc finger MYM-type protein 1 [Kryptolebias marmoratus]